MKTINVQDTTFDNFKKLKVVMQFQEKQELTDSQVLDIVISLLIPKEVLAE